MGDESFNFDLNEMQDKIDSDVCWSTTEYLSPDDILEGLFNSKELSINCIEGEIVQRKLFEGNTYTEEEYERILYGCWNPPKPKLTPKQERKFQRTGELPYGFIEEYEEWEGHYGKSN